MKKASLNIEISVYRDTVTGEFYEDDSVEVISDGLDRPSVMVTLTLVEALNALREENAALRKLLSDYVQSPA